MQKHKWIKDHQVRRRVPKDRALPLLFDAFVRSNPPIEVAWNDIDAYGLKREAAKEALPFIHLGDGGLVAFWYRSDDPAIIYLGSEGELQVIARTFGDFLKQLIARRTGIEDLDEAEPGFRIPGVKGRRSKVSLSSLQKELKAWFQKNRWELPSLKSPDAERLRKRLMKISRDMLADGRCKVYTLKSSWWSFDYRIERNGGRIRVTYLDFGRWYPLPRKYGMHEAVEEVLQLVKSKHRRRYELSTCIAGIVSVDNGRELLLEAPCRKRT